MIALNTYEKQLELLLLAFVMVRKYNWKLKLGIVIMAVSVLLFLFLPVIPFLDVESKTKITTSTIVFITAEITFYGGGFLVGKEIFSKYKSYLNPKNWFRKKQEGEVSSDNELHNIS